MVHAYQQFKPHTLGRLMIDACGMNSLETEYLFLHGCKERLILSSTLSIIIYSHAATILNIYNNLERDAPYNDAHHHDVSQQDQTVHSGGKKGKITRQH